MATQSPPDRFDVVRQWDAERAKRGWWHSFELPDGTVIEGVLDVAGLKNRISQFPIPEDLRGKRVLDIGAWDGWFSFEMERRGAEVLAIDNWDNPRFHEAKAMLHSRVEYRQMDMYDLTPNRLGRFDIVLFMGVLYHLKHPLLALERVCALTTGMAAVDSYVLRERHRPGEDIERRPVMEFYENTEFGGQIDNWVGPSLTCLQALCRTAGFARVELQSVIEHGACLACYRHWEPPPVGAPPGPELISAWHIGTSGINFDASRDESVAVWFGWDASELSVDDLHPEVGGYGVRPLYVKRVRETEWQANLKLPLGLTPGWHEVRVRIGESRPGSAIRIAVDVPLVSRAFRIEGIFDAATWAENRLDRSRGDSLSLWASGLPENADVANVAVQLNGQRATVTYVSTSEGARQINVTVTGDLAAGPATLVMTVGQAVARAQIEVA